MAWGHGLVSKGLKALKFRFVALAASFYQGVRILGLGVLHGFALGRITGFEFTV